MSAFTGIADRETLCARGPVPPSEAQGAVDFEPQVLPWNLLSEQQPPLFACGIVPDYVLKSEPLGLAGCFVLYSVALSGNNQVILSFIVFLFGLVL